ncbi:MAG TPA: alpha-glucosidase/alpha-galactosidase [Ktedonobacteraceae bacterium]|nr:alpha-glucosidase/alpha-galactosidase [Ktedonobacteraceae bacterium]
MPKIAFIGAGSVVFTLNLLGDILSFPELAEAEIALMDIDAERLHIAEMMAHKVAASLNAHPTITVFADRKAALADADYVINTIQVGGYPSTLIDFEIPKRYGLQQTIGDTMGIGGIFRALRTIPVMLDMCFDMEEVCPDVLFLNYVNPMAMNTWAVSQATSIRTVGLCHSVQGTARQLARYMGIPYQDLTYRCAGINHMAFYLELKYQGKDAYPLLREAAQKEDIWRKGPVRFELFKRLGYFVTESSEHSAEYNQFFIRRDRPDLVERFHIPIDEYLHRCQAQNLHWEQLRQQLLDGTAEFHPDFSGEYAALIIHSMETNRPRVIYGNVINDGLIANLPQGCCVEVPCLVDSNGLQPTVIGPIPPQLAALQNSNITVQGLVVEAALTGNREHVYHAAMFDPHTSAELTLDEIYQLVDDLFEAHGAIIPEMS